MHGLRCWSPDAEARQWAAMAEHWSGEFRERQLRGHETALEIARKVLGVTTEQAGQQARRAECPLLPPTQPRKRTRAKTRGQ